MSILSSPRISIASARTPSPSPSRRSVDSIASNGGGGGLSNNPTHRKNRAALRDYYNLRPNPSPNARGQTPVLRSTSAELAASGHPQGGGTAAPMTDLDSPGFDPEAYVSRLMATTSLSTVLKAESSLMSDMRMLDGERNALVYDNYSKLIRAVGTIGKMRASIEEKGKPMVMEKTLTPAISQAADTAASLVRERETRGRGRSRQSRLRKEQDTVRWVLDVPRRFGEYIKDGRRETAEKEWEEIDVLLAKWKGTKGVQQVREACEDILKR